MLFLGVIGFFLVLSLLAHVRYGTLNVRGVRNGYDGARNLLIVVSLFVAFVGFGTSGGAWYEQINSLENVKKFQKVETIYYLKAKALTAEFAKHLAGAYPQHERDIFEKISPDKVSLYLAKYPELRASETLVALVGHINKLQSDMYDQRIKEEEAQKEIRVRLRNPWFFTFMIPRE